MEQVIKALNVQAYLVQPTDDGAGMAVVVNVAEGTAGFAFTHDLFARFSAKVLEMASTAPLPSPGSAYGIQTTVVPVSEISFEPDPAHPSAVLAAAQLGRLRLAFSVDADMLLRSFKQYLDRRNALRKSGANDQPETNTISTLG